MPEFPTGVESQNQPLVTRWQRFQNFLSNLALLFAILGGVGIAGGGVIFLWIEILVQLVRENNCGSVFSEWI